VARQYAKSAQVRQTILEACMTAFEDLGFHAVTMAEIARRAGISHTGMLHYFTNKEEMLMAVLRLRDVRGEEYLLMHGQRDEHADPVDVLREMIQILTQSPSDARGGSLLDLDTALSGEAAAPTHPAHDYFQARYRNNRRFFERQFEELAAAGRLDTSLTPGQLAALTLSTIEGARRQWLFELDDELSPAVLLKAFLATVIPELAE